MNLHRVIFYVINLNHSYSTNRAGSKGGGPGRFREGDRNPSPMPFVSFPERESE